MALARRWVRRGNRRIRLLHFSDVGELLVKVHHSHSHSHRAHWHAVWSAQYAVTASRLEAHTPSLSASGTLDAPHARSRCKVTVCEFHPVQPVISYRMHSWGATSLYPQEKRSLAFGHAFGSSGLFEVVTGSEDRRQRETYRFPMKRVPPFSGLTVPTRMTSRGSVTSRRKSMISRRDPVRDA